MQERFQGKFRNGTNRRPAWDYTRPCAYFVTICTRDRVRWFGGVRNGIVCLSDVGSIVADEWTKTSVIRSNIGLDAWIVMPDHIHGIVVIRRRIVREPVAAAVIGNVSVGTPWHGAPTKTMANADGPAAATAIPRNAHHLRNWESGALGTIIQQFKRACTVRIHAAGHTEFSWQPRYFDRVIRNAMEADRIRAYIRQNPSRWTTHEQADTL